MKDLHVIGMHGLGDNLHQRAMVRGLMKENTVWLETPWPSVYHDMVGPRLKLMDRGSPLRTQAKNAKREARQFTATAAPQGAAFLSPTYRPEWVRQCGCVLSALCTHAGVSPGPFDLPLKAEWLADADALIATFNTDKPIVIYRPLVERREWGGCAARNPDHLHYRDLFESIRERFFVVSLADLVPGVEWIASMHIEADREFHKGELGFTTLAGLFKRAALVFASPGFAVPLAQAVGTRVVCVFGGYENSNSFRHGFSAAKYLGIDPKVPCQCFSHNHACQKAIDMPRAIAALKGFIDELPQPSAPPC